MAHGAEGAQERPRGAARRLFARPGYPATTVDQNAAPGCPSAPSPATSSDQEEVLLDADGQLLDALVDGCELAPPDTSPAGDSRA